jgi:predicted MFS family arabinose efflux permease
MAGGMLMSALALLALPFVGSLAAVFVCVCALGLVGSPVDVALLSLRQRKTERDKLGRVLAISMSLNLAGFPLGSAISGPLVSESLALGLALAAAACALAAVLALATIE